MSRLREIVLRFDTHDAVVELDKIIRVDVEQDIIATPAAGWDMKLGPHIGTIVVEAENVTAYARPKQQAPPPGAPALPTGTRPRRLLRRNLLR